MDRVKALVEFVKATRPVRVWLHFSERRGSILAQGLSFQALFAAFAAIWVGFATAGLVLRGNPALAEAFFDLIATSAPGLIEWNGVDGVIDPATLLEVQLLGITGVIAAGALAFTALGWLQSARDAVRALFDLPAPHTNFFLLKLKDVGLGIAFGIALIVSAALTVFSTEALVVVLGWVGMGSDSAIAGALGRTVGLLIMLAIDATALGVMFRWLSGLVIPVRRLLVGVILGGVGLGVLKVLGTVLLGAASRNPLLASFAVLIGLLIWFNLVCTVILLSASWIAVGLEDAGIVADPRVAREREKAAALERERLEEVIRAKLEAERRRGNWFTRLLRRDRSTRGRDDQ
ncbi:MAG TPA: YhjD/YihY/BrkB family envelope integrity protein [Terrimesophilobacter sp.]|nr:YhjD/YihY/BrkB family envelope integrity protein [Terrimesophilobacter sp.]HRP99799.1 YhjD/YihY/BrkB family envelope integrity protein [Terrimesophilobacter sp.]